MFCMKCGTQLPEDAMFCCKCGNKVVTPESQPQQSNVAAQAEETVASAPMPSNMSRFEKLQYRAKEGNVMAMTALADAYLKGKDCVADKQKAIEWYQKAADMGDEDARKMLDSFSEQPDKQNKDGLVGFLDDVLTGINDLQKTIESFAQVSDENIGLAISLFSAGAKESGIFAGSNKFYVQDGISQEALQNAMNTYGYECDIDENNVWLLCDDTLLVSSGTIGFVIDGCSIATSRKISYRFADLQAIELDGYEIVVTDKEGNREVIYDLDGLSDADREYLDGLLEALTDICNKGLKAFD